MHEKHGAFYLVRQNKWRHLGRNLHDALVEYARLVAGNDSDKLENLVSRVLADMAKTVAAGSFRVYRHSATRFLASFGKFAPEQIKPFHIARFMDDMKGTPGMANNCHNFMRGLFKRAVRWGVIEFNPMRDIDRMRTRPRERYITAEEFNRIYRHATPTLQCLMDLAYITGQRIVDLFNIRHADITGDGIFFRQKKTGTRILVKMTPDLSDVIARAKSLHSSGKGAALLFHRRDGTLLRYPTINEHWRKACQAAGVENAKFHDIRAAAATDARAEGLDSRKLLGHTTEQSHNRYLRSRETPVATPNKRRSF